MTIKCPSCDSLDLTRNGNYKLCNGSTKTRFKCVACSKRFAVSLQPNTSTRYVITSAVPGADTNQSFFDTLQTYCKVNTAKLLVLGTKNKHHSAYDFVDQYLTSDTLTFEEHKVKILGSLHLGASLENPLSGFDAMSKGYSLIVGHPQVQLKTLPRVAEEYPAILTTTGSISTRMYSDTKQGTKSNFNHSMSAVVLELGEGDVFFIRHLNFDEATSSFYDIDKKYSLHEYTPSINATALVTGDEHVEHGDSEVLRATYTNSDSLLKTLSPRFLVRHDVFDGHSISHHHEKDTMMKYHKYVTQKNNVEAELDKTVKYLNDTTPPSSLSVIVQSNHNEHLQKWLNMCDPKTEPWNAKVYHKLMYQSLEAIEDGIVPDAFQLYAEPRLNPNVIFIDRNKGLDIHKISIGIHGDVGANGSRGSRKQFSLLPKKCIVGHSHSPGIEKGCYQVGTSSKLRLEYNKGASSWHHAHCIIHPNGKRQLIFIVKGLFKI